MRSPEVPKSGFSQEEERALMERRFLLSDGRIDRRAIAEAIFDFMRDKKSRDEAVSNLSLAFRVLGVKNPSPRLMQLISSLMGPTSLVQRLINGAGGVLLKFRGEEPFENLEGAESRRRVVLRWVSFDDEDIWTHGVLADLDTYKRKADRSREFFAIVEERRPALAPRLSNIKALAAAKVEEGLALPRPRKRGGQSS